MTEVDVQPCEGACSKLYIRTTSHLGAGYLWTCPNCGAHWKLISPANMKTRAVWKRFVPDTAWDKLKTYAGAVVGIALVAALLSALWGFWG